MVFGILILFITFTWMFFLALLLLRAWIRHRAPSLLPHIPRDGVTVGFFHPYCNAGGGGERVLWTAIRAIQKRYRSAYCLVYTGDSNCTSAEILACAEERFDITLPREVEFVWLRRRPWVEASRFPLFTLLGQSLGSVWLGLEALMSFVPDVYIDSMGYSFTLPLFRALGGCRVACYVHYPTISTDMVERVSQRHVSHNNRRFIARNALFSNLKLIYYRLFARVYSFAGSHSQVVMVNSSWTLSHIQSLWRKCDQISVVFPPCDVDQFLSLPLQSPGLDGLRNIISIGQFRPEKNHMLMIEAFSMFLSQIDRPKMYHLLLVGSCRDCFDVKRVEELKEVVSMLGISDNVEFHINVDFSSLKDLMISSTIGLHAMWNEHFGIGIVECMASGLVVLAHNSGGPKLDIVTPHRGSSTGFLASIAQEYVDALTAIFKMSPNETLSMQVNARDSILRFSQQQFEDLFLDRIGTLLK